MMDIAVVYSSRSVRRLEGSRISGNGQNRSNQSNQQQDQGDRADDRITAEWSVEAHADNVDRAAQSGFSSRLWSYDGPMRTLNPYGACSTGHMQLHLHYLYMIVVNVMIYYGQVKE